MVRWMVPDIVEIVEDVEDVQLLKIATGNFKNYILGGRSKLSSAYPAMNFGD
jgi:hypothetical protein